MHNIRHIFTAHVLLSTRLQDQAIHSSIINLSQYSLLHQKNSEVNFWLTATLIWDSRAFPNYPTLLEFYVEKYTQSYRTSEEDKQQRMKDMRLLRKREKEHLFNHHGRRGVSVSRKLTSQGCDVRHFRKAFPIPPPPALTLPSIQIQVNSPLPETQEATWNLGF